MKLIGQLAVAGSAGAARIRAAPVRRAVDDTRSAARDPRPPGHVTLFLAGDVMTGRGIDQILPFPGNPRLPEEYVKSAARYVELAEALHGEIPKPATYEYVWGDALEELRRVAPAVRIVNLETAITRSEDHWPGKGIHYRMHPGNISCLSAAGIDCCALANNHVLDWGYPGLGETLDTLKSAGIASAGAGRNAREAGAPALLDVDGHGRVVVFAFGSTTSGIPSQWAASNDKPGVNLLDDLSNHAIEVIATRVSEGKRAGDIVVASIHWGSNWGYAIPQRQQRFARELIDEVGIDVVHGHSSHHVKGIEIYRGKPILYGCGDFLTDYEGIEGREQFRDDLGLMYFVTMDRSNGKVARFGMTPTRIRRFQISLVSAADRRWLRDVMNREGGRFGTSVEELPNHTLILRWKSSKIPA